MSDKKHVHLLSELYAHPIAHNIEWLQLISALSSIGLVHTEKNGAHHFTRNGHTVVFEHSNHNELGVEEIMKLRHFLHSSAASQNQDPDLAKDAIVAIDFHKAIIFLDPGMVSEARTAKHADLAKSRKLHKLPTAPPFRNVGPIIDDDYFDSVIKDLANARRIVVLGHGTGSSNAASQLMAKIHDQSPEIASKVTAIQRCDLEAMSEPQMVSLGKKLLGPEYTTSAAGASG